MAKALEIAYEEFDANVAHYTAMRDELIDGVLQRVPNARLTGHRQQRLASHASFIFEGIDSSRLIIHLDMKGIAASGGSACKTGNPEPSGVLLAMGYSEREAIGSLRLTVGRQTTEADIEYTIGALAEVIEKLYRLTPTL
jgi:cysteine desulfurase